MARTKSAGFSLFLGFLRVYQLHGRGVFSWVDCLLVAIGGEAPLRDSVLTQCLVSKTVQLFQEVWLPN